MLEEVVGTAVDVVGGYDIVTGESESVDRICNGSGTGSDSKCGGTALQCCDPVLEDCLGGVVQPSVDVSGLFKGEPVGGLLGILENVRCGEIDRNRPGIGYGVGLLLSLVDLESVEPQSVGVEGALGDVVLVFHCEFLVVGHACSSFAGIPALCAQDAEFPINTCAFAKV